MSQTYEIKIKCNNCKKEVNAKLVMDHMQVLDSPGIMLFDYPDGPQCDKCLTSHGEMHPDTLIGLDDKGNITLEPPKK